MQDRKITYRREQLYEEIWAEPVRTVAQRYGISDVALAKICRRLAVPRPGVGYWAKVAAGQQPGRPPLPKAAKGVPEEIPRQARETRSWVHARAASVGAGGAADANRDVATIEVASVLEQPHSLVAAALRVLGQTKPDVDGVRRRGSRRCLDVAVSPATFDRAMLIMDALLKALEREGTRCEVTDAQRVDSRGRMLVPESVPLNTTRVCVDDEWCELRLAEKFLTEEGPPPSAPRGLAGEELDSWRRWNRPVRRYIPSGVFKLSLSQGFNRATWTDGKRKKLEGRLADIVAGFHCFAAEQKADRAERERRHREYEAEMQRRREAAQRAEDERIRGERLEGRVGNWKRARAIREYVDAVHALVRPRRTPVTDPRFTDEALAWALAFADRIDPLSALRPEPEPPRPAGMAGRPDIPAAA